MIAVNSECCQGVRAAVLRDHSHGGSVGPKVAAVAPTHAAVGVGVVIVIVAVAADEF